MKSLINLTIVWQLIFSIMLAYPESARGADPVPTPPASVDPTAGQFDEPSPEDLPFDYSNTMNKDDLDDSVKDSNALNLAMMLSAVVAGGLMFYESPSCLIIPSVAVMGPVSILFLIREAMFMSEYEKLQHDDLKKLKTNVTEAFKQTQAQSIDAALEEANRGLSFAENKRNWALAYRVFLVIALVATGFEIVASYVPGGLAYTSCIASGPNPNPDSQFRKIVEYLSRFVGLDKAQAMSEPIKWLTALGLPAATAGIILATAKINKRFLNYPIPRAVFVGIMIVLSEINLDILKKVVAAYRSRRDKIQAVKDAVKVGKGKKIESPIDGPARPDPSAAAPAPSAINPTKTDNDQNACVSGGSEGPAADPSCNGPAFEMKPLDANYAKFLGPDGMSAISAGQTAAKNYASGKDSKGKASLLGYMKNKNAIRDSIRKNLAIANKNLAQKNMPPIDMKNELSKMYGESKAALLKSISETPGASVASLGAFSAPPISSTEEEKKENVETAKSVAAVPGFQIPIGGSGYDGYGSGDGINSQGSKNEDVNTAEALKGKKFKTDDINKNSGLSIFTVLSVRYKISAYPKFFHKTERKAATKPAVKVLK